ncbi:MAG: fibronectin type III domain-containing protein, partial [Candidatus Binatia bacterium]
LDELSIEEFLARFPAGEYEFEGKTIDGIELESTAIFSHAVPAAPTDLSVAMMGSDLVISWMPAMGPAAGFPNEPIIIVSYQVVVDGGDPSRRFDVTVPATATQVTVPPEYLQPDTEYEFEVLAIEASGNQTITEGEPFMVP